MTEIPRHKARSRTIATASPDWYPVAHAGVAGQWDGQAWTGTTRPAPHLVAPPTPARNLFGFLKHAWFLLLILGWLITIAGGAVGAAQDSENKWWLGIVAIGLIVSVYGFLLIFEPLLRFSELSGLRQIAVAGVISGVVGFALSAVIQSWLEPLAKLPLSDQMWLTGIVEESAKLLVPLLLWKVAGDRFRDPRAGMLMVLISGATLGILEGVFYVKQIDGNGHLVMAGLRTASEIAHPLFTAIAAALIWLAAHRAGRLFTLAGLGGWALAAAVHSLLDGIGAGNSSEPDDYSQAGTVAISILGGNVFSAIVAVVLFFILRHFARELTPPTALAENPSHWRPQIKQWGNPRDHRARKN